MSFDWGEFSDKQLDVIEDPLDARITVCTGAVRSGKTISLGVRWALYVRNETKPGAKLLMLGVTQATLKRNVIDDILEFVGPKHAQYKSSTDGGGVLTLFGRRCYCLGANDEKAEGKIRGMTVAGAYIDEATKINPSVLKQAILRCSKEPGRVMMSTNPDSPLHWLHTEYVGNEKLLASGRVRVHTFTLDDNLTLPAEYRADLEELYTGVWYQRMVLGLWVVAEGTIYDFFTPELLDYTDAERPNFASYDLTIDYGTQNPFASYVVGNNADESWYDREYYWDGRAKRRQKTDAEYSHDLRLMLGWTLDRTDPDGRRHYVGGTEPDNIYIDPSAASMIAQLRRDGWRHIRQADNTVDHGLRTSAHRMKTRKVRISKARCPNLVRELQVYQWDAKAAQRGEDAPLKQNDHGPDALRYREHTKHGKARQAAQFYEGSF